MNIKSIFSKVLPTIAATIVPGGPLAQMGINAVSHLLGDGKVEATADGFDAAVLEAQKTNPNIIEELKRADADLQARLAQMGYDSEEKILALQNADRSDARAREVAVKDRTPMVLAISVTIGFFGMLIVLAFAPVQQSAHDILIGMTATLGSAWLGVIGYYFGSSSGSAAKTKILADQSADK